jgi:hypothetical protein
MRPRAVHVLDRHDVAEHGGRAAGVDERRVEPCRQLP